MKSTNFSLRFILFSFLASFLFFSCGDSNIETENEDSYVYHPELSKSFEAYEVFSLDYNSLLELAQTQPTSSTKVNLDIPAHPNWEFDMVTDDLSQYDEEGFEMIVIGVNDAHTVVEESERFALQGFLNDNQLQSFFTFSEGKMEGLVQDNGSEYWIQSLSDFIEEAPVDLYIMFDGRNEITENVICDVDDEDEGGVKPDEDNTAKSNTPKKIYITYVGDYQYYQEFNNWSNANNWMYWRYYYANKRYNAYNAVPFNIVRRQGYLYSSSGSANYNPKTASNKQTFVDECSAYYNYSWYNEGDVNYFFTGDNVTGVWGKADGISKMCSDPAQAFSFGEVGTGSANSTSKTYFGQNLMAHEVGHSIAAYHDNSSNNWMNSNYNNWNTSCGNNAKNNFNSKYNNSSCLGF